MWWACARLYKQLSFITTINCLVRFNSSTFMAIIAEFQSWSRRCIAFNFHRIRIKVIVLELRREGFLETLDRCLDGLVICGPLAWSDILLLKVAQLLPLRHGNRKQRGDLRLQRVSAGQVSVKAIPTNRRRTSAAGELAALPKRAQPFLVFALSSPIVCSL